MKRAVLLFILSVLFFNVFAQQDRAIAEVFFKINSYKLSDEAKITLESLNIENERLVIVGYADGLGDELYNYRLAMNRALSVKKFLTENVNPDLNIFIIANVGELYSDNKSNPMFRKVAIYSMTQKTSKQKFTSVNMQGDTVHIDTCFFISSDSVAKNCYIVVDQDTFKNIKCDTCIIHKNKIEKIFTKTLFDNFANLFGRQNIFPKGIDTLKTKIIIDSDTIQGGAASCFIDIIPTYKTAGDIALEFFGKDKKDKNKNSNVTLDLIAVSYVNLNSYPVKIQVPSLKYERTVDIVNKATGERNKMSKKGNNYFYTITKPGIYKIDYIIPFPNCKDKSIALWDDKVNICYKNIRFEGDKKEKDNQNLVDYIYKNYTQDSLYNKFIFNVAKIISIKTNPKMHISGDINLLNNKNVNIYRKSLNSKFEPIDFFNQDIIQKNRYYIYFEKKIKQGNSYWLTERVPDNRHFYKLFIDKSFYKEFSKKIKLIIEYNINNNKKYYYIPQNFLFLYYFPKPSNETTKINLIIDYNRKRYIIPFKNLKRINDNSFKLHKEDLVFFDINNNNNLKK